MRAFLGRGGDPTTVWGVVTDPQWGGARGEPRPAGLIAGVPGPGSGG